MSLSDIYILYSHHNKEMGLIYCEHLQEFTKSTWHPFIFGKTGKIVIQQFGI
jgi:hypothetical protein